jgi:hypothetical protein
MAISFKPLPAGFIIPAQPVLASKPPSGGDWVHEGAVTALSAASLTFSLRRERFGDELLEREVQRARFTVYPSSDQRSSTRGKISWKRCNKNAPFGTEARLDPEPTRDWEVYSISNGPARLIGWLEPPARKRLARRLPRYPATK